MPEKSAFNPALIKSVPPLVGLPVDARIGIGGWAKIGKTTLTEQIPGAMYLAFESGYAGKTGITHMLNVEQQGFKVIQPALEWAMNQKVPPSAFIIDTVDSAVRMIKPWVLQQFCALELGMDNVKGKPPYAADFRLLASKFFERLFDPITRTGVRTYWVFHTRATEADPLSAKIKIPGAEFQSEFFGRLDAIGTMYSCPDPEQSEKEIRCINFSSSFRRDGGSRIPELSDKLIYLRDKNTMYDDIFVKPFGKAGK